MEGSTKKKRVKVRLYRLKDMDLISLYLHDPQNFIKCAENAVEADTSHVKYIIPVPDPFENNYKGYVRQMLTIHIEVSSAVLRTMARLKPKMNQAYIIACIRDRLERIPKENFFKGDGLLFNKIDEELDKIPVAEEKPKKASATKTTKTRKKKESGITAEPVESEKPKLFKTFKKPAKRKLTDDDLKTIAELKIEERGRETKARKAAEAEAARQAEEARLKAEAEKKQAEEKAAAVKVQASEPDFPAMPIKPITDDEPAAVKTETIANTTAQEEFPPLPIKPMVDDTSDDDDDDLFAQMAGLAHMN
jgi:hypothetical protein